MTNYKVKQISYNFGIKHVKIIKEYCKTPLIVGILLLQIFHFITMSKVFKEYRWGQKKQSMTDRQKFKTDRWIDREMEGWTK